jgi:RNA polymerase sigma-70 factor (ECF subfamily)
MDRKKSKFIKYVQSYKNLIFSHAYYSTGTVEEAEDITQEIFLRLWRHMDSVKKKKVRPWLLRVTRNLCIDRSRKIRERHFSEFMEQDQNAMEDQLMDEAANPEDEVIQSSSVEHIMNILNKLPEKLRTVVIMRDVQDLPYDLIAESMDMPLNTVKSYIHRGRKMLAKKLIEQSEYDLEEGLGYEVQRF